MHREDVQKLEREMLRSVYVLPAATRPPDIGLRA
jgi:hypothetical protein